MASSYTTSFGIEKIGSGEQSGAWGTTTNYNLDLLDRITAYTSVALSGTTHTLTVREASPGSGTENLQDGMYRVIKFTGALGGDNTVTIAPNTTKAFFIIHNATTDSGSSGPYSVILTQGSGANITVANGKNAVIYCDGAGSGAIVVDAVSNLALATVTASGDVTSAGTVNVTGDTAAGDGASIGYTSSEGLILTGQGSTNDVTIKNDADADVITIATGATNVDVVGDLTAGTLNADGDTSAGDNAAMGYTAAEGLILTGQGSTNDVTIKNDADADVLTIPTGTTAAVFAGNMRMTKGGDIASASPLVIDTDGNYFDVTGTTNFAAMTVAVGNFFMLQFDGALTITHGSGIELPGAANLTTAAGDRLICYATAADTVEVMNVATEAAASAGGFTLATPQTPTSGTSVTFSGIPAGTTMVVINLHGITLNATTGLDIQIGDSGGIETSDYNVAAAFMAQNTQGVGAPDTEWLFADASQTDGWYGQMTMCLTDSTNNIWTHMGIAEKGVEIIAFSGGSKALSAALTQIKFKSRNGSATFTAGTINIMYQ